MRRRLFCSPSISVVGWSPMTQISSPGRSPAAAALLPASTDLTAMTPLWRVKVKSIRSKEERFRWKDAKAPATIASVSRTIKKFRRAERRMEPGGGKAFKGGAAPGGELNRVMQKFG